MQNPIMDFEQSIIDYKENNVKSSPIWIWFIKEEKNASCTICIPKIPRKDGTTGGMVEWRNSSSSKNNDSL